MTRIQHHLPDQILMAYATGVLAEAYSLVVATHVSLCDDCRAQLASFEAIGGALIEETEEEALSEDALAAALARIDREGAPEAPLGGQRRTSALPEPLRSYTGGDLDAVRWRRVGGGVAQAILPTEGGPVAKLLRIPAGVAVPDHSHGGMELTLVLQGAFRDADQRFGPGDVDVADDATHHRPVAMHGSDCICLAATDAPLRFHGILPRIAQRVLRL